MALTTGQTLGQFEILELLGVGGMGEVYRARDLKLGREVALKVVRPGRTDDADGLSRFMREAKLLAHLNHPHIATLFDLEEADGVCCLIMELVSGPTLAEYLRPGPLAIPQACDLARQIADALESAHGRGIMHRDLKPANIKLTDRGQVKVLDFGLAKALKSDAEHAKESPPTISFDHTGTGIIVGTPAYMSPEQARGETVDARTDVWAFGCVLFEMLTGRRAFAALTVAETLVAVLEREPDWSLLPAHTPAPVRDSLQRCLRKDPKRRLRDIRDVRVEIEEGSARWNLSASLPMGQPLVQAVAIPAGPGLLSGAVPWASSVAMPASVLETLGPAQTLVPAAPLLAESASMATAVAVPAPSPKKSQRRWVAALLLVCGGVIGVLLWNQFRPRPDPVQNLLNPDNPFDFLRGFTDEGLKLQKHFLNQFGEMIKADAMPLVDDVAVLPFETPFEWFEGKDAAEQLAAALTEALGNTENLRVTSHAKVMSKGLFFNDVLRVGRELGAASVLTGKIKLRPGELEVYAELVTVGQGTRRWGKTYTRQGSRLGAVQQLAQDIAAEARVKLMAK